MLDDEKQKHVTKPYQAMGELFAKGDGFFREEAKKFTDPEYFSLPVRWMMQFVQIRVPVTEDEKFPICREIANKEKLGFHKVRRTYKNGAYKESKRNRP